jgi:hypothetical protein
MPFGLVIQNLTDTETWKLVMLASHYRQILMIPESNLKPIYVETTIKNS